ncbi:hypothetical protein BJX70DRAFT_362188 [Aspergillus crustosus]
MLRSKPTCVALTEDDLGYHIDSIFSRNEQLTKWHRERTGSGNSYDGDDDEDGLFLDSDSFSLPETLLDSECDETQSHLQARDSPGESEDQRGSPLDQDNNSLAVNEAGALDNPQRHVMDSAQDSHSRHNSLQLALWPSEHSPLLALPNTVLPQPYNDPDDTGILTRLLANLFLELTGHFFNIQELANTCKVSTSPNNMDRNLWTSVNGPRHSNTLPVEYPPSHLPGIQLTPQNHTLSSLYTMEYSNHMGSKTANKEPQESEIRNTSTFKPEPQGFLTGMPFDHASTTHQLSLSQHSPNCSTKRRGSLSNDTVIERGWEEDPRKISSLHQNTVSRATQTEEGPINTVNEMVGGIRQDQLGAHENIAPGQPTGQHPSARSFQDPFISAMFPEFGAPIHDITDQYRRSVQGHVNQPSERGRANRNPDGALGQLVHPTMVDASVFQEYVDRLTSELDRAP